MYRLKGVVLKFNGILVDVASEAMELSLNGTEIH